MSGRMSRNKGARNERLLVEHLKKQGYAALRVPLSGAMKGYKHDVTAIREGVEHTFELKVRAREYGSIYAYYAANEVDGVVRICNVEADGTSVELVMSDDLEKVKEVAGAYPFDNSRTAKKLFGMRKLLNGAQFLVIRGDRMGFLFIQYSR
jgi:Holliday junction resolvase